MRPPNLTDDEVRELALQLRRETGKVPVHVLRQAARGGHQRISRILRELNAASLGTGESASADGDGAADPREAVSQGVRVAVDQLLTAIEKDIMQAAAESDARSRAAEQVLANRHQAKIAEVEGQRSELEGYLDDLGTALTEAEEERSAALDIADEAQRKLSEVEAMLDDERRTGTEERSRLETELSATQQAERRSNDALHASEVAKTEAEATLRQTREALDTLREDCQRLGERCSVLQAGRDQFGHEARALRAKVDDLQRELDAERTTNRRLEQLLVGRLGEQAVAPKSGAARKKPSSKKDSPPAGA